MKKYLIGLTIFVSSMQGMIKNSNPTDPYCQNNCAAQISRSYDGIPPIMLPSCGLGYLGYLVIQLIRK